MLALAGNRDIYYRANLIEELCEEGATITPTREGTHWVRLEQSKEDKIIFKWVRLIYRNINIHWDSYTRIM